MEKKVKQRDIEFSITYDLNGKDIDELSKIVKAKAEQYPDHFNWRFLVIYGYDYNDILLSADRMETDKELQARIVRSKKSKEAAKKRKAKMQLEELQLLEKLQKKYEKIYNKNT